MAESEDRSKIPYFMLDQGDNDYGDDTDQYQEADFDYNNDQNNYRNEQYNNAYGICFGGYGPNCGFNQNFPPPYPGFYGFPPFQHPPGPPPRPQGPLDSPNNIIGQGFGSNGPPVKKKHIDDKIIKALIRCGVPKDNLKNLPRNLLKQYHPEFCGLCSQSFDTMTMSRLHYICRNHLKNQKKWLSQQTDSGFRRNKEQPLKARELYCEICDVHITSKQHSESHYAGKPHKATYHESHNPFDNIIPNINFMFDERRIVEGRKNPKNPFLMQRGMEDRLEQLIRREKKHLRLGQEEQTDFKEARVVQPDLCCQICGTSVTCPEQMIMHLNGKRHLAKEKHHILKMMTGGGDSPSFRDGHASEREKERNARKSVEK